MSEFTFSQTVGGRLHMRIQNYVKHLIWSALQKWLTGFSCGLFSQNNPS